MPTIFTHAIVGVAIGKAVVPGVKPQGFWWLLIACAVLPDADVIGFFLGIPYQHPLGHRGLFHSLYFALFGGCLLALLFFRNEDIFSLRWWHLAVCLSLATASHGLLDMLTNGGLGIALWAPFDNTRHFFDWRPIVVSPLGVSGIFSARGLQVLQSELLWICLPTLLTSMILGKLPFYGYGKKLNG